jgi:hypothetical protein
VPIEIGSLDPRSPFEFDMDNRPHLFKHDHYGESDIWDVWESDPVFIPAAPDGPAELFMVAEPPGEPPLAVPLAAPRSSNPSKARPIGIYPASGLVLSMYTQIRQDEVR